MRRLSWSKMVAAGLVMLTVAVWSAPGIQAAPVIPVSYDMTNGQTGSYNYRDFTYLPDPGGVADVSLSSLSGGQGKLTDGDIPDKNWNQYGWYTPYVGWQSINPTITFNFSGPTTIDEVRVTVDNSRGSGGVYLPSAISIAMGSSSVAFPISQDASNGDPRTYTFTNLGLSGSSLDLTVNRYQDSYWIMVSEVQFESVAAPVSPTILLFGSGLVGLLGWRRFC